MVFAIRGCERLGSPDLGRPECEPEGEAGGEDENERKRDGQERHPPGDRDVGLAEARVVPLPPSRAVTGR